MRRKRNLRKGPLPDVINRATFKLDRFTGFGNPDVWTLPFFIALTSVRYDVPYTVIRLANFLQPFQKLFTTSRFKRCEAAQRVFIHKWTTVHLSAAHPLDCLWFLIICINATIRSKSLLLVTLQRVTCCVLPVERPMYRSSQPLWCVKLETAKFLSITPRTILYESLSSRITVNQRA